MSLSRRGRAGGPSSRPAPATGGPPWTCAWPPKPPLVPGVPDEHGFGHEVDGERLAHAGGDLARQADELRRRAAPAVDERERVLGGDRHAPARESLVEARALDEPRRRGLHAPVALLVGGRAQPVPPPPGAPAP